MNTRRAFFISTLLLLLLACVIPGLSPTPKPTADNRLQAMLAETVAAAVTQTALAFPPTFTPTSTPTFTPEPTITPTALPVGSLLIMQEDDSTLFMDQRAGYTIIIPEGWLALRVKEQEFLDALTFVELSDPLVYETLIKVRDADPGVLRLFAADIKDAAVKNEPVATIKLIWDEKRDIPFNSDEDLRSLANELAETEGMEVTSMDLFITPAQIQFGVIESKITGGDGILTIQKRVFFKGKTGTVYALLTTGLGLKEDIIPAFDVIMDTVKLLP
jgi:hypothetical protein